MTTALSRLIVILLALSGASMGYADTPATPDTPPTQPATPATAPQPADQADAQRADRQTVKLPGMIVDFERGHVDVEAKTCIERGMLELVACIKGTKEHESIVEVLARPMHIHTGLLLLGARNGHPAKRQPINEEKTRWVFLPPRGQLIEVFIVTENEMGEEWEQPIGDFIRPTTSRDDFAPEVEEEIEGAEFPSRFIFAGSILHTTEAGEQIYLADKSGHVITVVTFGDELLCLPEVQSHANQGLMWEANPDAMPPVGTEVILRLRPVVQQDADPAAQTPTGPSSDAPRHTPE